jgi:hypothetical protein
MRNSLLYSTSYFQQYNVKLLTALIQTNIELQLKIYYYVSTKEVCRMCD